MEKPERGKAPLHVRWQGGHCKDLHAELPRPTAGRWRHSDAVVQRVRACQKLSDDPIAVTLEIFLTAPSHAHLWIRHKHAISPGQKEAGELSSTPGGAAVLTFASRVVDFRVARLRPPPDHGSPYWITIIHRRTAVQKWVRESKRIQPR